MKIIIDGKEFDITKNFNPTKLPPIPWYHEFGYTYLSGSEMNAIFSNIDRHLENLKEHFNLTCELLSVRFTGEGYDIEYTQVLPQMIDIEFKMDWD